MQQSGGDLAFCDATGEAALQLKWLARCFASPACMARDDGIAARIKPREGT